MKKLFYEIWVDCIVQLKKQPFNKNSWKWKSMLMMILSMSFNFMFLLVILGCFIPSLKDYTLKIDLFVGSKLDNLVSYIILFGLPLYLINYFLILYKEKYKKLIDKYEFHDGKYFLIYFLCSLGIPWIGVILYFLMH